MKIIDYREDGMSIPAFFSHFYSKECNFLFFDIETTGFVAKNTTLYLISVLWYEDNHACIRQWFNDDGYSEKEILLSFWNFCKNYTHLVHFNGIGFDLPYLKQKATTYDIAFDLEQSMDQLDIYKEIRPYKNILALDNLKQVSIERFLNIDRKDTYSGKELINIYQRYIAKPNQPQEALLLLHNHDDLLGMPKISEILNYKAFFERITIVSVSTALADNQFIMEFDFDETTRLSKRLSVCHNGIYLNIIDQHGILSLPVINDTLKHYFHDYRNYFYLPKEDMAIHKSVATYVEKENKVKAKKDTCYIRKTDQFIPCFDKEYPECFQSNIKSPELYQTLDSLQNAELPILTDYIKKALAVFR